MTTTWNLAELDAECAVADAGVAGRRLELLAALPAPTYRGKLCKLPGEPGTPAGLRRAATSALPRQRRKSAASVLSREPNRYAPPPRVTPALLAELRKARRAGTLSRNDARAVLGLAPRRWWQR